MPATTENKTADLNTAKGLPSSDENNFEKRKKAAEEGYTFILSKEVSPWTSTTTKTKSRP